MRWIVDSSLKLRFMVIVIAAGIILVGITQLDNMPVDILPEFEPTFVEVHTEALGLSAEEVEQLSRTCSTGSRGSRRFARSRFPGCRWWS